MDGRMNSLDEIRDLAPEVVRQMGEMLGNAKVPDGEGSDHGDDPGTDIRETGGFGAADQRAAERGSGAGEAGGNLRSCED